MATANFPVILAGTVITASLLAQVEPNTVIKPSDQSVTSSTTLVNDSALAAAVGANATYIFAMFIDYEGIASTGDLKFGWTVPASTTMKYIIIGNTTGGAAQNGHGTQASTPSQGGGGAGVGEGTLLFGTINTASAAGTVQFQWAQNTSNATATKVHAGSALILWEVS